VRAIGNNGQLTAFSAAIAAATSAYPPLTPSGAIFTAVSAASVTANWSDAGNPIGTTLYQLRVSTDPNFSGVVTTSATYNTFASSAGLSANTTYYFDVNAFNYDGFGSTGALSLGGV